MPSTVSTSLEGEWGVPRLTLVRGRPIVYSGGIRLRERVYTSPRLGRVREGVGASCFPPVKDEEGLSLCTCAEGSVN